MTIAQLNAADKSEFVARVGFAFEDSAWIALAAWEYRPFRALDDLHAAMVEIVQRAGLQEQLALICAHPDLAGRLAREGRLTPASREEQSDAGLDLLTPQETARFDALNAAYREGFGFPFVICVREQTKESILVALEARLQHDREAEIRTALREIAQIARLRLESVMEND